MASKWQPHWHPHHTAIQPQSAMQISEANEEGGIIYILKCSQLSTWNISPHLRQRRRWWKDEDSSAPERPKLVQLCTGWCRALASKWERQNLCKQGSRKLWWQEKRRASVMVTECQKGKRDRRMHVDVWNLIHNLKLFTFLLKLHEKIDTALIPVTRLQPTDSLLNINTADRQPGSIQRQKNARVSLTT